MSPAGHAPRGALEIGSAERKSTMRTLHPHFSTHSLHLIHLLIDVPDDLACRRALLGRPPSKPQDQLMPNRIADYAAHWGKVSEKMPEPRLDKHVFGLEPRHESSVQWFRNEGYRLHLTLPDDQQSYRDKLLTSLAELADCDCPIWYLGSGRDPEVRQALVELRDAPDNDRRLCVAHFKGHLAFEPHQVDLAADVVLDIKAAKPHY